MQFQVWFSPENREWRLGFDSFRVASCKSNIRVIFPRQFPYVGDAPTASKQIHTKKGSRGSGPRADMDNARQYFLRSATVWEGDK